MESIVLDILYDKTCFFCFKISPDMMEITEEIEIREPTTMKSLKFCEMIKYLFPAFDIICTHTCRPCSDLLIKMYVAMYKNHFIRNLIDKMTEHCNNIINKTCLEKQVTINLKLSLSKNKIRKVNKDKSYIEDMSEKKGYLDDIDITRKGRTCYTARKNYKRQRRKYYNCEHCTYRSLCKGTLEGHINKYHIKNRPFVCQVCYKGFYTRSNLLEHNQTHNRVAVCEICGDMFARKQSLINHLKLHSNNRAYKCMLCERTFINSGRRLEHMKRNHLEKNECCMFCEKRFGMKKELIRHVKSVHA
ncbi:zinc finger protein 549-like [Aricia agestis]|uniref:zinc finger protein 549-like n=1 Tax=Aricia agestis TaxID=91739 RepID=UPI001C204B20|nr:zinc finger protein 549-like [Aricia agestis]